MYFDQIISSKKYKTNKRLVQEFKPQKIIKTIQPNDAGIQLSKGETYKYHIFPMLDKRLFVESRPLQDYNQDSITQ